MYNDVTGIILAGGKSSRMGENKALLKIEGKTIIERAVDLMRSLFNNILLITNTPEEYRFLNIETYKDIYPFKGPLSGIHSGLFHSLTEKNFIISCDIPLVSKELLLFINDFQTSKPVTVVKADGFIQQLCGVYNKAVLPIAENLLTADNSGINKKSKCKVLSLIDMTGTEIIESSAIPCYEENMFLNVNRREDYDKVLRIYHLNNN